MSTTDWLPTAPPGNVRARARLYAEIRRFFELHNVLEVETAVLSHAGNPEPNIDSLQLNDGRYLNTSPEFQMKRMLAAGVGDCYQIGKAFRHEEATIRHNQEFSLLEWYRLGFGVDALIADMSRLLEKLLPHYSATIMSYRNAFQLYVKVDPFAAGAADKLRAKLEKSIGFSDASASVDDLLQLTMATLIEPYLPKKRLVFIKDFPAAQASLAQLNPDGITAGRFELFIDGLELANGFAELTDAAEQRKRFSQQNDARRAAGKDEVAIDERFLASLEHGLPACSGVALGLDRLLQVLVKHDDIRSVIAFPDSIT